jgi:hypothetical protein
MRGHQLQAFEDRLLVLLSQILYLEGKPVRLDDVSVLPQRRDVEIANLVWMESLLAGALENMT